jgi:hypothetical protein
VTAKQNVISVLAKLYLLVIWFVAPYMGGAVHEPSAVQGQDPSK